MYAIHPRVNKYKGRAFGPYHIIHSITNSKRNVIAMEEIKVGECYTLRNGLETGPIRISNNGTRYIYEADMEDGSILAWGKTGYFLLADLTHKYDITHHSQS